MALRLDKNFFNKIIRSTSAKPASIDFLNEPLGVHNIEYLQPIIDWQSKKIGQFRFSKASHRDFKTAKKH